MTLKLVATVILITAFASAQQAQQARIVRPVDNRSVVRLHGTLSPRARVEFDRGPVPAAMPMQRMTMVFSRTAAQQAALDQLLAQQQDPASPNYHKWLTPEEYGARFGLAEQDVNLVAAWLTSQGFTVDEIAPGRTSIAFSGIAAQVDAAFHAQLHNYVVNGETHYAPSAEAGIPEAFAGVVAGISGLHDFLPHARSRMRRASPRLTSSISGSHYLAPGDFGTIYNLPDYTNGVFQPGNDGTGQTIAIVGQATSQSGVSISTITSDVATFRSVSNLPTANLTTTPVGSTTNFASGDAQEASLDIEWSGAVAPNASLIFVYSNNALLVSLPYIVDHNLAPVISVSYGECEPNATSGDFTTIEGALQRASTQGQTVVVASGDNGATDCDTVAPATHGLAVDYPASSTLVTAMGGTTFTGDSAATPTNGAAPATQYWNSSSDPSNTSASAFSYIPETTWNDSGGTIVSATGGGKSQHFVKPPWQVGVPPADGQRDVPDLALSSSPAHDGYIICSDGSCQTGYRSNSDQSYTIIGGTSTAVPTFAGIVALLNQKLGAPQGFLNSKIYSLATSSSTSWAFNDIDSGNNLVPCQAGSTGCANGGSIGYSAGIGYDQVTGWGSVDATALINAFNGTPNPHFLLLPASRYVSPSPGNSSTVSVSVTPKEGFTGPVSLTCAVSSSLTGVTCTFDNTSVTTPGTAILTIQPGPSQVEQTGTVTLQGTSGSNTDSVVVNVTIAIADFQISSGNNTESVPAGSSITDTISVTSVQGFSGSVSFTCNGTTGLTCSLSPTSVTASTTAAVTSTLTVTASSSAANGSVTITASGNAASGAILTHTLPIPVTVTAAPPDFTLTVASPVVSISSGGIVTDNLTVAPIGSFSSDVALTCTVPSSLGATTCTISPSTVPGANGTALVTLKGATLALDRGAPLPFRHRGFGEFATFVFALGIVFTAKPMRSRNSKRAWLNALLGMILLCLMFGAVSCGGGGGSSSSGSSTLNGNVTITGVSGNLTHTATINITVHQ
jgi:hypothetical protein